MVAERRNRDYPGKASALCEYCDQRVNWYGFNFHHFHVPLCLTYTHIGMHICVRRWDCDLCHIIPQKILIKEFGLKRPQNRVALLHQSPLFVLGHDGCNKDGKDKHLYTYKREELQLPCSKAQLSNLGTVNA